MAGTLATLAPVATQKGASPHDDLQALRPEEAMKLLAISRTHLWRLIGSGELPSILFGRSRRILRADLIAYLEHARTSAR